jgi:hypothetical protein
VTRVTGAQSQEATWQMPGTPPAPQDSPAGHVPHSMSPPQPSAVGPQEIPT